MVTSRAEGGRGKDGMFARFSEAMVDVCKVVPNFGDPPDYGVMVPKANKFYKHFIGLKRFKSYAEAHLESRLPEDVVIDKSYYRCTSHPEYGLMTMWLPASKANPLEVLHILAHYVQPSDSPWHGGEFGAIFLDFVERSFGPDVKREVKDIMLKKRLRTFVKSEASRLKQSEAYHTKKVGQIPQGLVSILADIREIRS